MGERFTSQGTLFQAQFNRAISVEPANRMLTEDPGALLLREVAEELGVPGALDRLLRDARSARKITHPLVELVLTRVALYGQGYRQQDDADRLRQDGALRMAVTTRGGDRALCEPRHAREPTGLASQPTLSRLNDMLASEENLDALRRVLLDTTVRRLDAKRGADELVIDVDSFAQEVHGHQEGSAYNGHYHMSCLHPLIAFTDTGDILGVELRPGNVHTAEATRPFLEPILEATRHLAETIWVRVDAGYASGAFFDWLEERDVNWVTRLKSNAALTDQVARWRDRIEARWAKAPDPDKPRTQLREFWYAAGKWSRRRRVIAVLVERDNGKGELFNDLFFLATNTTARVESKADILARYRRRGIAEQHIGEFKRELWPTLSSPHIAHNQVTALIAAQAYELMHHLRETLAVQLADQPRMTLATLRAQVLKVATLVVRHARRVIFRICNSKAAAWRELGAVPSAPRAPAVEGLATK